MTFSVSFQLNVEMINQKRFIFWRNVEVSTLTEEVCWNSREKFWRDVHNSHDSLTYCSVMMIQNSFFFCSSSPSSSDMSNSFRFAILLVAFCSHSFREVREASPNNRADIRKIMFSLVVVASYRLFSVCYIKCARYKQKKVYKIGNT